MKQLLVGLVMQFFGWSRFFMKMMRYLFIVIVGVVFLLIPLDGYAYKDGDWQYWNTEAIKVKINDNLHAYMEEEFRFGDDASEFYYQHSHLQLDFKLNDMFTFSPAYRQVFELYHKTATDDDWYTEYRPMLNGTAKFKLGDWSISDRIRVSYRMFNIDKKDVLRVRNKIKIKTPWKFTLLGINPWVADEIFMERYKTGVYRNRLYIGVGFNVIKQIKGDIFYLWQSSEKEGGWIDYNVVGTKLKLYF